jgi:general secretion pathway protein I
MSWIRSRTHRGRVHDAGGHQGFTLIEVLIALTIIAVALAAIIKATTAATSQTTYLRDKTFAHWVAMNRLAELQVEGSWPGQGNSSGTVEMAGPEEDPLVWRWTQTVKNTPDPGVRQVDIEVLLNETGEEPLVTLTGYLARPPGS